MATNGKKPERPLVDPDISRLVRAIRSASDAELYHNSYLSRSTIQRLRTGKTRRPTHMTMTGIAAAAGMEFRLVPKGERR